MRKEICHRNNTPATNKGGLNVTNRQFGMENSSQFVRDKKFVTYNEGLVVIYNGQKFSQFVRDTEFVANSKGLIAICDAKKTFTVCEGFSSVMFNEGKSYKSYSFFS